MRLTLLLAVVVIVGLTAVALAEHEWGRLIGALDIAIASYSLGMLDQRRNA